MTPQEIHDRLGAIRALLPAKSTVSLSLSVGSYSDSKKTPVSIYVSPHGWSDDKSKFSIDGADWEDVLTRAYQHAASGDWNAATIRKMALSIIDITEARGQCPQSALIEAGFKKDEIEALGERACELAGKMADGAPFSISTLQAVQAAE